MLKDRLFLWYFKYINFDPEFLIASFILIILLLIIGYVFGPFYL